VFRATDRVNVNLQLLHGVKPLKDRAKVHFHCYSQEMIAEVRLLGSKELKPGYADLAQLRLAQPMLLLPGDRFILRQFSPVVTIGGGAVLDNAPLSKSTVAFDREFLRTLQDAPPHAALAVRIARRGNEGLSLASAVTETGLKKESILHHVTPMIG